VCIRKAVVPSPTGIDLPPSAAEARPAGPACFVGRQIELSELLGMLRGAEEGAGGAAILEGEPGIGKTRTAEEFAAIARGRGATVLCGRCYEGEVCPPYGPWIAALGVGLRSPHLAARWRLMGEDAEDIAEMLPELRLHPWACEAPVRLSAVDGEYRLHASIAAFLRAAAHETPLLVTIDNLHLADAGTLKFLRHLAPELAGSRVTILGTLRSPSDHHSDAVMLTIEELQKTPGFRRLHLGGLGRDDVRELLARSLPADRTSEAMADAIHERTEGNPLFVVELVRQMARGPAHGGEASSLPAGIRQAIERRLARLSHRCRKALQAASVLGRSFERDLLLRSIDGFSPADLEEALREARKAAVISVEDPALGRCRFVHALVQETLREQVPADALIACHVRAARAIRQSCGSDAGPRSVDILAHLLEGAVAADPDEMLRAAGLAAAHAIERYAPDQALDIIDRTFGTWERLGRGVEPRMAELFHLRGALLTDLQRPEEARESLARAFDLALEAGDRRRAIEVATTPTMERSGAAWLYSFGGGGRGVAALRERALAMAPQDSAERAWLVMQRGSRTDLREALSFAWRCGDTRLEATASTVIAHHELLAWEFTACERLLEAATRSTDRLGDPRLATGCAYIRYWLGILTARAGPAAEGLRQMSDLAGRCRSRRVGVTSNRCAAELACLRGDWSTARRQGEQALAMLQGSEPVYNRLRAIQILLRVDLCTGNVKAAARCLAALHRLTDEPGPDDTRSTLLGARVTGDAGLLPSAPARTELESADGPLLTFLPVPLLHHAAVVALHRDSSKAPFYLAAARRWSGTFYDQPTDGILGMLCDVMGEFDEAVGHYERALEICRRAGYLPDLAMACSEFADTLVRRGGAGDLPRAARLLDEGLELCDTLGMSQLVQRIRERRGLLTGTRRCDHGSSDGLTPREAEVLRMVARGFTNAEIAERLFISPLTVARHVHNLLEKTGTANRAEAAAWAARGAGSGDGSTGTGWGRNRPQG